MGGSFKKAPGEVLRIGGPQRVLKGGGGWTCEEWKAKSVRDINLGVKYLGGGARKKDCLGGEVLLYCRD